MNKFSKYVLGLVILLFIGFFIFFTFFNHKIGDTIDSYNNVDVYYNGYISNIEDRNISAHGYNIGLRYQCVEFVKRYYYEFLNHKMPNSYGNAVDFFDISVLDGNVNKERGLLQFTNPSKTKPMVNNLIVFKATTLNKYGHVAIITKVEDNEIEIIQQNAGVLSDTRATYSLEHKNKTYNIEKSTILGWLRKRN